MINKYGFDYFTKRAELLTEMARPSKSLTGPEGDKMSEYGRKIGQVMMTGGEFLDDNIQTGEKEMVRVPGYSGNPQNRRLKYIIDTIVKFDNIDIKFDEDQVRYTKTGLKKVGSNKDDSASGALKILGVTDTTGISANGGGNALLSAAITKWVKENPEKVMSKEFEDLITTPNNILYYLKHNRSSPHNTGRLKDERMLATHGGEANPDLSIEDVHDMSQRIKPLLNKIHRAQFYIQQRKNGVTTPDDGGDKGISNVLTSNITVILHGLEAYITLKKVIDRIVGINFENVSSFNVTDYDKIHTINDQLNTPLPEMALLSLTSLERGRDGNTLLEDLYEEFDEFLEDGISFENYQEILTDTLDYAEPTSKPFLTFLINNLLTEVKTSSDFPGYYSHVLEKYLGDDPENWEAFSKFYEWQENERYRKSEERKSRNELRGDMGKHDEFKGELPAIRRNYAAFLEKWKKIANTRQIKYANSLKIDDEGNYINQTDDSELSEREVMVNKIKELEGVDDDDDYIAARVKKERDKQKPKNESYVMNYMTEQFQKDKFKPKGEFKDRGFRKPTNYWQGRNL